MRSDESSLGILRCTHFYFVTTFNHLYIGTGCVCFLGSEGEEHPLCVCVCVVFFLGGNGGTPLRHGHKESYIKI